MLVSIPYRKQSSIYKTYDAEFWCAVNSNGLKWKTNDGKTNIFSRATQRALGVIRRTGLVSDEEREASLLVLIK